MASYEAAIDVILRHEGYFSDDPVDPGGTTKYGISLRFIEDIGLDVDMDGDVDPNDIRALDLSRAKELYYMFFWYPGNFDQVECQEAATKLFDAAVNMGPTQATMLACRVLAIPFTKPARTPFALINAKKCDDFVYSMCTQMTDFYIALAEKRPKLKRFLKGWTDRAKWPFVGREIVKGVA